MQSRYSRDLAVIPEDVKLLTNVEECCIQGMELFHFALQQSECCTMLLKAWALVEEIYVYGL